MTTKEAKLISKDVLHNSLTKDIFERFMLTNKKNKSVLLVHNELLENKSKMRRAESDLKVTLQ